MIGIKHLCMIFMLSCVSRAAGDGIQVLSSYTSLADAVSTLGSTETDLFIDQDDTLFCHLVIPENIRLSFSKGNVVTLGAYHLTVNGPLEAGPFQIFNVNGSGSVHLNNAGIVEGYAEFFGVDGVADEVQINEAFSSGIKTVRLLPNKTYQTEDKIYMNSSGQELAGSGGNGDNYCSIIECSATSGPVIEYTKRSIGIYDVKICSTATRYAASTSTGFGILGRPSHASSSRPKLENILICEQPTDGIYIMGGMEHGVLDTIVVIDCKRHGFLFDDGTTYGQSLGIPPFEIELVRCRAMECGGNALVLGASGDQAEPDLVTLNQFEALGCCWNSSSRISDYQIDLAGAHKVVFNQVDIEDQQYAESITCMGNSRTVRATPACGMYIGSQDITLNQPYFSSLSQSVVVKPSSRAVRIVNPRVYSGNWGGDQDPAFEIPGSAESCYFEAYAQSGATNCLVQNQSTSSQIIIDGVPYVPTASSAFDISDPYAPVDCVIESGTLTAATTKAYCNGENGQADSLAKIRYYSGADGYLGYKITLFYAEEPITVRHGVLNILCKTGADTVLNSTNRMMSFVYDGANWLEQ